MHHLSKISVLFIALLSFALFSCNGSTGKRTTATIKKSTVKFDKSAKLSNVLDKATAEGKLVFVDFYTSWCLPCKMMDQDVFTDQQVIKFLNENFISYKVNAEKGNGVNLAFIYDVQAYPTLLFLDGKGKVLEKKIGAAYQSELMAMGNRALANQQASIP